MPSSKKRKKKQQARPGTSRKIEREHDRRMRLLLTLSNDEMHPGTLLLRYEELAKTTRSCEEANKVQCWMFLAAGHVWGPIVCPHCGKIPSTREITAWRPPCSEYGHREQLDAFFDHGREPTPCVLCGETPTVNVVDGVVVRSSSSPPSPGMPKVIDAPRESNPWRLPKTMEDPNAN